MTSSSCWAGWVARSRAEGCRMRIVSGGIVLPGYWGGGGWSMWLAFCVHRRRVADRRSRCLSERRAPAFGLGTKTSDRWGRVRSGGVGGVVSGEFGGGGVARQRVLSGRQLDRSVPGCQAGQMRMGVGVGTGFAAVCGV